MADKKRKLESILSLKEQNKFLPSSLKKCLSTLQCGVLTKSPIKPTINGSMFSMKLCDSDPSINTRAVCYDTSKYDLFEPKKTYEIQSFKLKKGYGNSKELEMVIHEETQVMESSHQFKMERCSFEIGQVVRGETANVRYLNVKGKVVDIGKVSKVGKYPDLKDKRDVILADKSGHITLVLWRERAKDFDFAVGDVLDIESCVVSTFNKVHNLTATFETTINKIQEDLEIASAVSLKAKPDAVVQEVIEITALKDFTAKVNCSSCNMGNVINKGASKQASVGCVVRCDKCKVVFMAKWSTIFYEAKFLIGGTWYTGRRGVLDTFFGNIQDMENPGEDQMFKVLTTKYSVRLNTDAKKIESAEPINEEEEVGEEWL